METREPGNNSKISKNSRRGKGDDQSLVFSLNGNSLFELPAVPEPPRISHPFYMEIERYAPELTRIGSEHWQTPAGDVLDVLDVIHRYPELNEFFRGEPLVEPPWLKEIRSSVDVRFIRSERLMVRRPFEGTSSPEPGSRLNPAVKRYAEELATAIKTTLTRYAELSQSLDRTFPVRLVRQTGSEALTKEEIKERSERV